MDEFLSEKEQIEQIRNWWSENGRFVITGLVLGVGALGGWRYWQEYKVERAESASAAYESLVEAVGRSDRDTAVTAAGQLRESYGATPYADHGELALARLYVDTGDTDGAAAVLRGLVAHAGDDQVKHVARLRLARVLAEQGKSDEALDVVSKVASGPFASQYHEVRGDIHAARDEMDAARDEYQKALDSMESGLADPALLEMKLNDASGAAGPAASNES